MWIDTHCHLDAGEFHGEQDAIADDAASVGVSTIVIPAVAPFNFDIVAGMAHRYSNGCYALGIHPICVPEATDSDLTLLRDRIARSMDDPKLVAVGEIGLD